MSADILNDDDLVRLSEAINLLGIKHGKLTEGKHSLHFNLSDTILSTDGFEITDNTNIFIKLDRGHGKCKQLQAELDGLNYAYKNNIPCPRPLWPDVCSFIDGEGNTREFVIVKHIGSTTMAAWINVRRDLSIVDVFDVSQDIIDCLNVAKAIHSIPAPKDVELLSVPWLESAPEIIALFNTLPEASSNTEYTADEVKHLKARFLWIIEELRTTAPTKGRCWVHGDFHLTNLIHQGPSEIIPVDWEMHWNGTPEYDLAQLTRDLMLYGIFQDINSIELHLNEVYGENVIDLPLLNLLAEYRTIWSVVHLWNTSERGYGKAADFLTVLHLMWRKIESDESLNN